MNIPTLSPDPGPCGWNAILPDPDPVAPLTDNITSDWLIIGAGFAGLSAAHRLTQLHPSDKITVLEARGIATGPAGRNSGFMIDLPHDLASDHYSGTLAKDLATTQDNRRAIAFAANLASELHMPADVFAQSGKINGAASDRGLKANAEFAGHLSAMSEPYELMDAAQMREMTGINYYQGGLYTPGAAIIQPAAYVRALAQGLQSNRARVYEGSPVIGLVKKGDWVATTPKGQVTTPNVILAVNGQLQNFGYMSGRLVHMITYASMTRSLTDAECDQLGGSPVWGLTSADPMGTTVRRISGSGGNRIIVRNRFTYEPKMEPSGRTLAAVYADHDKAFSARFPMLKAVEMEYRWGGRLCLSLNDVQVIGELDDGLWSACCQNGLGTVRGTLAGVLAAEAANGISSPALDRALQADAPKRLPPEPIARIGAQAKLRWGERRAGKEM